MPTVAFTTLGCKLNQYETQSIRQTFEDKGYTVVPFTEPADVYVINTCVVTGKSAYTSRKMIRRAIRTNPNAVVAAVGCYGQVAPAELAKIDGLDLVVGNGNKTKVVDYVEERCADRVRLVPDDRFTFEAYDITRFSGRDRVFIKVQEGCEASCSYCIIPRARGKLKSRPLDGCLEQVRKIADAGYREVVITGTHLGCYGQDRADGTTLVDLLQRICAVPGLDQVRLSSLEPMDVDEALLDLIVREKKICRHLHIPLQSGDNAILRKMNRPYTAAQAAGIITRLAGACPSVCIGTDIITAFPGETEEQYRNTYDLLVSLPLAYLHVFPFSPRPGTPAAGLPDRIAPAVSKTRVTELNRLRAEKIRAFRSRFIGQPVRVLVESTRDRETGRLVGISDNYLRVLLEGPDDLMNSLVTVVPAGLEHNALTGRVA